jgi:hypothetical protein
MCHGVCLLNSAKIAFLRFASLGCAPTRFALKRFASLRSAHLRLAPSRSALLRFVHLELCSEEQCFAQVGFFEVCEAESCFVEFCAAEVWLDFRMFFPPLIPSLYAPSEDVEVTLVCQNPSSPWIGGHEGRLHSKARAINAKSTPF